MPTQGEKLYSCQRITVPALGTVALRYDVQPDQIIFIPEIGLTNHMDVELEGVQGGAPFPLYAMGPLSLMGASKPQSIRMTNNDAVARVIRVAAQKGYPQIIITPPTTLVSPTTADIQSQLVYEIYPQVTPHARQYSHAGRYCVVLINLLEEVGAAPHRTVASVTLGGAAGTLLGAQQVAYAATEWSASSAWLIDQSVEGMLSLIVTLSGAAAAQTTMYVMALSFTSGIRMGNVGGATFTGNLGGVATYNVIGQSPVSRIFSVAGGTKLAAAALPAETAGAAIFDPIHHNPFAPGTTHWTGVHIRTGLGAQTFTYTLPLNDYTCATVGVEVLPA